MAYRLLLFLLLIVVQIFYGQTDSTDYIILNKENSLLPTNSIHDVSFIDDEIWIATWDKGIVKIGENGIKQYNTGNSELGSNKIYKIIEGDDEVWASTYGGGLARIKDGKLQNINTGNSGLKYNWVYNLYYEKGKLYICTWGNGLQIYDGKKWVTYDKNNSPLPYKVPSVLMFNDTLWVGSIYGLYSFAKGKWKKYGEKEGLPEVSVYSLLVNRGIFYVGFKQNGLAVKKGKSFIHYNSEKLGFNICYKLAADNEGNIYTGSFAEGVGFFGKEIKLINLKQFGLKKNLAFSVSVDKNNNKWVSTYDEGILIFNEKGLKGLSKILNIFQSIN